MKTTRGLIRDQRGATGVEPVPMVRVWMTIARTGHADQHRVLVEAPAGTTLKGLRPHVERALPRGALNGAATISVAGKVVPDDSELGLPPLTWGQTLTVSDAAVPPSAAHAKESGGWVGLHSLHSVSGFDAGRVHGLGRGTHLIGRSPDAAVRISDPGASRAQARVHVGDDAITVAAIGSTNPTLLNRQPLTDEPRSLEQGASLRLGHSELALTRFAPSPAAATWQSGRRMIHRRPRIVRNERPRTIEFGEEPKQREGMRMPMLAALAPVVISAALAWVTGSALMLLFALLSPVMLLSQWFSDRRHGRRSFRRAMRDHNATIAVKTLELAEALASEQEHRRHEHPDLAHVSMVAKGVDSSLWQRSSRDSDYLVIRLGVADLPARTQTTGTPPDHAAAPTVAAVPCTVSMPKVSVLGVAGPRDRVLAVCSGIIGQLMTWHSPHAVRLALASTASTAREDWGWASGIAHFDVGTVSALRDCMVEGLGLPPGVSEELAARRAQRERDPHSATGLPDRVVILDGAHDLRRQPEVAEFLRDAPDLGYVVICLDADTNRLPSECRSTALLHHGPTALGKLCDSDSPTVEFIADLPSTDWIVGLAGHLRPLEDATPADGAESLPVSVGFREVQRLATGSDPLDADSLAARWREASGGARSTLGLGVDGPFDIDLVTDGPHALVGGTTGSGKSELLRTFVAGLAAAYGPDDLSFVLIDYKGGSAFRECARLPHVAGLVTDLDAHLTARALTSLDAEVKRRERAFHAVGAADFVEYQRLSRGGAAISRLVLVVDEFRMLADELPEFVDGLVRIAAVGRSLGIHVVLATQRPSGIVTADMRANIALRIALRVRDTTDSEDVIESSVAAKISERTPGRCHLRTAGLALTEVQTAEVSRPIAKTDTRSGQPRVWITDWTGRRVPDAEERSPSSGPASDSIVTELTTFVQAALDAADMLGLARARSPWLPPLPDVLRYSGLPASRPLALTGDADSTPLVLGLSDRPTAQDQVPFGWSPASDGALGIAGGARSGRTTCLQAIAVAVATTWSPADAHVHVVTASPGEWEGLSDLPQIGSISGSSDPARAARVLAKVRAEVCTRRAAGRQLAASVPRLFVLIDGWESLEEALDTVDHGRPVNDVLQLLREGQSVGVHLAITGGRQILVGRIAGLVGARLALRMPDPLDLTMAGLSVGQVPTFDGPGRAIDLRSHDEVQLVHVRGQDVTALASDLADQWKDVPKDSLPWKLRPLPPLVSRAGLASAALPTGTIPVAVTGDDHECVGLRLDEGHRRTLIIGPRRSGRSETLATVGQGLLAAGRRLAVVARAGSMLRRIDWPTSHGDRVLLIDPNDANDSDALMQARRDDPELAVLVDDAEAIVGQACESELLEISQLAYAGKGFIAVAVDVSAASTLYRGLVPEVARDGVAITLGCSEPDSRDLLGTRAAGQILPGRGHLVLPDETVEIQVAIS